MKDEFNNPVVNNRDFICFLNCFGPVTRKKMGSFDCKSYFFLRQKLKRKKSNLIYFFNAIKISVFSLFLSQNESKICRYLNSRLE